VTTIEGAEMRISTDLVLQQTNSSSGINGRPVQAVYVDPKENPTQALQLAAQLVDQDKVDVLAGGVTVPECQALEGYAAQTHIVYVPLDGCGGDELTARSCDRYTLRVFNAGGQLLRTLTTSLVQLYGKRGGIIYADYAIGQFVYAQTRAILQSLGGDYVAEIAVPFGESNVTPYVTRIPTDGSIDFLEVIETGTDLALVMSVVQQFGINQKVPIFAALGKDAFGGLYPDAMNGALTSGSRHASVDTSSNPDDAAFEPAWKQMAHQDAEVTGPLGGPDNATPRHTNAYNAYISMNALKLAMRSAGFSGIADTDKLISAFESLNMPQGPDFPDGPVLMNKADHQGRTTQYLLQIDGQQEHVVRTFLPDQVPTTGTCQIAS
jgi:branched-chain amino acid transport system substrate-binding protein